jgi:hypothetical protein
VRLPSDPEAWGAYTGIPGAFLLALGGSYGKYGWLLFLASNVCWIVFATRGKFKKLLLQQLAFLATTTLGLWNTLLAPWLTNI